MASAQLSGQSPEYSTQSDSLEEGIRSLDALPSPSGQASALEQQVEQQPATNTSTLKKTSRLDTKTSAVQQRSGQKRKTSFTANEVHKRRRNKLTNHPAALHRKAPEQPTGSRDEAQEEHDIVDPLSYWVNHKRWPRVFGRMKQDLRVPLTYAIPTSSYRKRRNDGEAPVAYTSAYEIYIAQLGMIMFSEDDVSDSYVVKESLELCAKLLEGSSQDPLYPYPILHFRQAWRRAQNRNEARIFRDITSVLVPSPELLFIQGCNELKHLVEEISVEWTKCQTLGGPRPKPDFAVGLAASAFTTEEMAKLAYHTSPEQPTNFTDDLYFPFVLCEAQSADLPLRQADRKNMHSSSLAVQAINRLCRNHSKPNALDGQILVFSISHTEVMSNIFGHFIYKEKFYRYHIHSATLNFGVEGRKQTYDFFREVYRLFSPIHLQRIQQALALMKDPRDEAMVCSIDSQDSENITRSKTRDEADGADGADGADPSIHSAHDDASFDKLSGPASKEREADGAVLREQLAEERQQMAEEWKQIAEERKQIAEERKQMAEERVQNTDSHVRPLNRWQRRHNDAMDE